MKKIATYLLACVLAIPAVHAAGSAESTRHERNYIVDGNKLYRDERFAEAEVAYRKALEENAMNEIARFNLAASLLRQGNATGENAKEAISILQGLARDAENISIAEKAFYNMGNLAFNEQNYAQAIDNYKNALRRNPDNDQARENLRLAQKRLENQQNQDQNQDQNQQNQDQNQDQNKDKEQNKDQDKNDQNKDQDKDQNKDEQNKKQDQQQQQPQDQKQQPQQQQQGGISPENAQKILKTMENEENATRARVNAEKRKNGAPARRAVTNPW